MPTNLAISLLALVFSIEFKDLVVLNLIVFLKKKKIRKITQLGNPLIIFFFFF